MVRFLVLYDTPDDPEAFDRHYREVHIPLTKKLPGLRRYTISRDVMRVRGGEACYLVAELDWDDMDSLRNAFSSPEGAATAAYVPTFAGDRVRRMIYEVEDV